MLEGMRRAGRDVQHLALPDFFPAPDPAQMQSAVDALCAVAPDRPLIVDGLIYGAIDPAGLARVRAPLIAMIHHPLAMEGHLAPDLRDHLFRTERDNLRLARHVLVPSPHTRDILTGRYGVPAARITIARPGVDRGCAGDPAAPTRPVQPPLILSVGILHPRKGHDILIEALSRLTDLAWQAAIVGTPWDPDHAAALHAQARAADPAGRIRLTGRVDDPTLHALYAEASLFALATRYEGYGIVFDEALLRGLPIVSCAVGAVPQTVPAEAAVLVPPEDPAALARALRRLLEDVPLRTRLGRAARRAGADLPGWDGVARVAGAVIDAL